MADNQHYVIDDGQNKIPGYSKEETDAAIDAAASNLSNLADAYDATKTYAVGDWCIYNSVLYQCKTAITTAEAWNAAHWQQMSVTEAIGDLTTLTTGVTDYTDGLSYHEGVKRYLGSVYKQGKIVICNLTLKIEQNINNNETIVSGLPTMPFRSHKFPCMVGTDQYLIGNSDGALYMQVNTTVLTRWGNLTASTSNPKFMTMMFVYATT